MLMMSASPALASPYGSPAEVLREGFESDSVRSYEATAIVSYPIDGLANGYWGPVTFRALSGYRGLWCNGSRANGVQYLSDSAGWANFVLTQTAEYYDSDVSFGLSLPSRGAGDQTSFGVKIEQKDVVSTSVYENFSITAPGQWRIVKLNLGADPYNPLARKAGNLRFRWTDRAIDPSENPPVGEGATIDDVVVTGWKYGPVRNLGASVGPGSVSVSWDRPYRAANSASPEERAIAYRIWQAPAGLSDWTEVSSPARIDGTASSYTMPIISEGLVSYSVQAWDQGSGRGYGPSSIVTAAVPVTPPTVALSTPLSGFTITALPTSISGTAGDVGAGVDSVQVRIRRADGYTWDGVAWVATDTWINAATSNGWANWSYMWVPDSQLLSSGQRVTISTRSHDRGGSYSPIAQVSSAAPPSGGGDPPPPVATMSLAGGAAFTKVGSVNAEVSAPGSAFMRYRVDAGPVSAWLPYSEQTALTLTAEGERRVTYEFSTNGIDVVNAAEDSIIVDSTPPQLTLASPLAGFELTPTSIAGIGTDALSGMSKVQLRIRRGSTFWNGLSWQTSEFWIPMTGAASWSYGWFPSLKDLAGYDPVAVTVRAEDGAGNIAQLAETTSVDPQEPTSLTGRVLAATIRYGATASVVGTLTTEAGAPMPNKPIRLEYYASGWHLAETVYTGPSGVVTTTAQPTDKTTYRLVYAGDADYLSVASTLVTVTPKVSLATPAAPSRAARGAAFTAYGYLKPRHAAGSYPVRIYRYRYVGGSWKSYGYVKAKASNYSSTTSKYSVRMSLPYAGRWRLRAVAPADTYHAATYSAYRYVTIR